ncbi:SufD family Fe-S cluster assembly protein [Lacticaseibacillus thailandensis]|uniref:SufD family Fe-S cluster assembly protein n=1 Tax=Lacticaseibacillus thailandensis TaxID=381741 RepID=UPI0006D05FEC|nr:SufD family Fe-S cluster assembly protein [Lacticaseibacillus thailandensis]
MARREGQARGVAFWPAVPKFNWERALRPAPAPATGQPHVTVTAGIQVAAAGTAPTPHDRLAAQLIQAGPSLTVTVPAHTVHGRVTITGSATQGGVINLQVGAGATVHIAETWRGQASGQTRLLVSLTLAADAQVDYQTYDLYGDTAVVIERRVTCGANSQLTWRSASFGHHAGILYHAVDLVGDGAQAQANMAVLAGGHARLTATTAVTNAATNTQVDQPARVITDHAQLILNGIGHILLGARGSDAQQENRVLMLSPHALGEANPLLLIDENDVTAGHAASVAAVDEHQLWYFLSRGVARPVALRLVLRGFLLALLPDSMSKALRDEIQQLIEVQLNG